MKRHYYISNDLDDLDHVEEELENAGVATPQMHVLSRDDAGVANRPHLHPVEAVLKKDVVRGTEIGAMIGAVGAVIVLAVAYFSGVTETVGWVPFVFLSVIVLGFCTWEGGLFGIQEPHADFVRFQDDLDAGKHVFFVDVDADQEAALARITAAHPGLQAAGEGEATPGVVVEAQKKFHDAMQTLP
ncbi:MAG: NAD/FAD-utilizing enzyme [Halieaceae bacterium]